MVNIAGTVSEFIKPRAYQAVKATILSLDVSPDTNTAYSKQLDVVANLQQKTYTSVRMTQTYLTVFSLTLDKGQCLLPILVSAGHYTVCTSFPVVSCIHIQYPACSCATKSRTIIYTIDNTCNQIDLPFHYQHMVHKSSLEDHRNPTLPAGNVEMISG